MSTGRPAESISRVFFTTASNFTSSVGKTWSGRTTRMHGLFVGALLVHRR